MNSVFCYETFQDRVAHPPRMPLHARVLTVLRTWVIRSRSREQLRELNPRLLQDIGVRYEDALLAARKPFWKP